MTLSTPRQLLMTKLTPLAVQSRARESISSRSDLSDRQNLRCGFASLIKKGRMMLAETLPSDGEKGHVKFLRTKNSLTSLHYLKACLLTTSILNSTIACSLDCDTASPIPKFLCCLMLNTHSAVVLMRCSVTSSSMPSLELIF